MNNQIKALAKHLDIEYFTYNNSNGEELCYIGMSQDEFDAIENDLLNKLKSREEVNNAIDEIIDGLDLLEDQLQLSNYDDNVVEYGEQEYLVVDDYTANDLWEQDLDNYIDECILPELNERYRIYFDSEAWKADARQDGRGCSLNRYDGNEDEETIEGQTFYIYRIN